MFLGLVVIFNLIFTGIALATDNTTWFLALMWSVAASSVICRLIRREGFADVSFRFGGRRTLVVLLASVAYPVVIGMVAYGIAWAAGIASYHTPSKGFLAGLLLATTVSTAGNCLATAGEEIGWRGYMLPRLIDAGVKRPVLVSGIIWAVWHAPLIITGLYEVNHGGSTIAGLAGFAMTTVSSAFVIARVRLETGSIWPAIVLHAAWNSVIQGAFDPATTGRGAGLWLGEGGLLVGIICVAAAILASRGRWHRLRAPGKPFTADAA